MRIIHPFPVALVCAGSLAMLLVAERTIGPWWLAVSVIATVFFNQTSIGALNDFMDRQRDATAGLPKPIAQGLVDPRFALCASVTAAWAAVGLSLLHGPISVGLVVLGTTAGLAYDVGLKARWWSWLPYAIGFLTLPLWIFVAAARFTPALLMIIPVGLPLAFAIHVANTLPDIALDRQQGVGNFGVWLGERHAPTFCLVMLALSAILAGVSLAARDMPRDQDALVVAAPLVLCLIGWRMGGSTSEQRRDVAWKLIAGACAMLAVTWLLLYTS